MLSLFSIHDQGFCSTSTRISMQWYRKYPFYGRRCVMLRIFISGQWSMRFKLSGSSWKCADYWTEVCRSADVWV